MITKREVKHLARLCRLDLIEGEEEKFQKELSSILDYVKQLEEIDAGGVEPTSQVSGLSNITRPDEIKTDEHYKETKDKSFENAPQKEGNYLKVKAVFDKTANV